MSVSMGSVISHDGNPLAIFPDLTFQLHHKTDDLTALGFKRDAQGIIIIQ
jgi:hypothetical protein